MANESFSDQIRRAIDSSKYSRYSICKHIKVDQSTMSRFMNSKGGLSMDVLDRLAELLGLRITTDNRAGGD
ncbi:MAG: helix-turn-helix domain-containing protein [Actinobacteria bacterium]|nr:helix-turn-helix domain-containing protein [Actinomycetota bacterium]